MPIKTHPKQFIKNDLQNFYDKEAKKYYETRKKYWKEWELLLSWIDSFKGKKIRILEFWCGSGRFASYLSQHYQGAYEYIGVDFSQKLLWFAKKDLPELSFVCEDISSFITKQNQESFDLIIGTSSLQHIPSYKERIFLMKHFYKALSYGGKLIMTNWSFSLRFLQKHQKALLRSWSKYFWSFWSVSRRDILVPWTNKGKTLYRFYHLFSLKELKKLSDFSGFCIEQLEYLDSEGKVTPSRKHSNSSIVVVSKKPIL